MICFSITCVLGLLLADPPIEGDLRLIQTLIDGQQSNVSLMTRGSLRASYREWGTGLTERRLFVRVAWRDARAFWEFDLNSDLPPEAPEKPGQHTPHYGRMVFNGGRYVKYIPGSRPPGRVTIFAPADYGDHSPDHINLDQRPSERWTRCQGLRLWAELLGPHPGFPSSDVVKWVITQNGTKITSVRHDMDSEVGKGRAAFVASLDFAGNVIETKYENKVFSSEGRLTWHKDPMGRVYLEREWTRTQSAGRTKYSELVISDVQLDMDIPEDQFDMRSLLIRNGAVVNDLIEKRRYTYGGRVVDQQALDALSEQIQQRGFARP